MMMAPANEPIIMLFYVMINLCSGATMPAYELLTSVTLHGVYRTGTEVSTLCRVT